MECGLMNGTRALPPLATTSRQILHPYLSSTDDYPTIIHTSSGFIGVPADRWLLHHRDLKASRNVTLPQSTLKSRLEWKD